MRIYFSQINYLNNESENFMKKAEYISHMISAIVLNLILVSTAYSQGATSLPVQDSVHPDFIVKDPAYNDKLLEEIQKQLEAIVAPENGVSNLRVPDYAYAYTRLQNHIAFGFAKYLVNLSLIGKKVNKFLRDMNALENSSDPTLRSMLDGELSIRTPKLNDQINALYKDAIRTLFLLDDNSLYIGIGTGRNPKSQFIDSVNANQTLTALQFCKTGACVKKLSLDIAAYYDFIYQFNQEVDFTNFKSKKYFDSGKKPTTPVVALAIKDAAKKLLKGFEPNKTYDLGGTLKTVFSAPGGILVGIGFGPVYLVEKLVKLIDNAVHFKKLKVELKLYALNQYSDGIILENLIYHTQRFVSERDAAVWEDADVPAVVEAFQKANSTDLNALAIKYSELVK